MSNININSMSSNTFNTKNKRYKIRQNFNR